MKGSNVVDSQESPFSGANLMVVVAHPDDEVLFAGSQLSRARQLSIIHVTDGAPSAKVARQHGFQTRHDYAAARRRELQAALRTANVTARCECLEYRDGSSCLWIAMGAHRLSCLIDGIRPDVILTHAYDGGHRDHDTTAAMVRLATEQIAHAPEIWEMAGYYQEGGRTYHQRLPGVDNQDVVAIGLSPDDRARKRAMLNCFISQQDIIRDFSVEDVETFRRAPLYNFTAPPVCGPLGYEANESGAESGLWRVLAISSREAMSGSRGARLRLALARPCMRLMLASFRLRRRHPRVTRPLEITCLAVLSGKRPVSPAYPIR